MSSFMLIDIGGSFRLLLLSFYFNNLKKAWKQIWQKLKRIFDILLHSSFFLFLLSPQIFCFLLFINEIKKK